MPRAFLRSKTSYYPKLESPKAFKNCCNPFSEKLISVSLFISVKLEKKEKFH